MAGEEGRRAESSLLCWGSACGCCKVSKGLRRAGSKRHPAPKHPGTPQQRVQVVPWKSPFPAGAQAPAPYQMLLHRDEELRNYQRGTSHIVSPAATSSLKGGKNNIVTSSRSQRQQLCHAPPLCSEHVGSCPSLRAALALSPRLLPALGTMRFAPARWALHHVAASGRRPVSQGQCSRSPGVLCKGHTIPELVLRFFLVEQMPSEMPGRAREQLTGL